MKKNIKQIKSISHLAIAITAATMVTACGSGGSSNDNTPAKPSGPITASNAATYVELALSVTPALGVDVLAFIQPESEIFGLPIGNDNIARAGSQIMNNDDGSSFFTRLCEDGTGSVVETTLEQVAPKDTQGDFFRQDFVACTFDTFAHDGSLMNMVELNEQNTFAPGDADPFKESEMITVFSYDAYKVNNISSNDNIAIDGSLTVERRVESTQSFLNPAVRDLVTFSTLKTDLYSIQVNVTDNPKIDYSFKDFTVEATEVSLDIDGEVTVKNGNRVYAYSIQTPTPLAVVYADAPSGNNATAEPRMIESYRGNMVITSGISQMRIVFDGDSAQIALDVDTDGQVDHQSTVRLNVN